MKIALILLALCAVAYSAPAFNDEVPADLPILDAETAELLGQLLNNQEAMDYLQNNAALQQLFKQVLGADLFPQNNQNERCLLWWLYLLSKISVTTSSG